MKYLIDTNILIDHLRGEPKATEVLRQVKDGNIQASISVITEYELLASSKLSSQETTKIAELLQIMPSMAITSHIAHTAANFHRQYRTDLVDALIAATAFLAKATLLTRNFKHFQNIRELHTKNLPSD